MTGMQARPTAWKLQKSAHLIQVICISESVSDRLGCLLGWSQTHGWQRRQALIAV